MNTKQRWVLAIDPGSAKCGYAIVLEDCTCSEKGVVPVGELFQTLQSLYLPPLPEAIVVGKCGWTSIVTDIIGKLGPEIPIVLVDETNSTYEARPLYFKEHPPIGIWWFVPLGLQTPGRPIDDYAAWIIGKRWWQAHQ